MKANYRTIPDYANGPQQGKKAKNKTLAMFSGGASLHEVFDGIKLSGQLE